MPWFGPSSEDDVHCVLMHGWVEKPRKEGGSSKRYCVLTDTYIGHRVTPPPYLITVNHSLLSHDSFLPYVVVPNSPPTSSKTELRREPRPQTSSSRVSFRKGARAWYNNADQIIDFRNEEEESIAFSSDIAQDWWSAIGDFVRSNQRLGGGLRLGVPRLKQGWVRKPRKEGASISVLCLRFVF